MHNVKLSGTSNKSSDENLEGKVIDTCKEAGLDLKLFHIEGCHILPSGRLNTSNNNLLIVKFLNRKHFEAILKLCI